MNSRDIIEALTDPEEIERLNEYGRSISDSWDDGITLIADSDFVEHARDLAQDLGMIDDIDAWPARCIDWDNAANELKWDYTSIHIDGEDYWTNEL